MVCQTTLLLLATLASSCDALVLGARPAALTTPRVAAQPAMQLFGGKKKTPEEILEEKVRGSRPRCCACSGCPTHVGEDAS